MTPDAIEPWLAATIAILSAVLAAGASLLAARTWKPGARELALVVQLQADGASLRADLAELRNELAELRGAQALTDGRLRIMTDHAWRLHGDLRSLGQEPRPWPTVLTDNK